MFDVIVNMKTCGHHKIALKSCVPKIDPKLSWTKTIYCRQDLVGVCYRNGSQFEL